MKFMMMMIPRVYQPDTPAAERAGEGFAPPADAVAKMMKSSSRIFRRMSNVRPIIPRCRPKLASAMLEDNAD